MTSTATGAAFFALEPLHDLPLPTPFFALGVIPLILTGVAMVLLLTALGEDRPGWAEGGLLSAGKSDKLEPLLLLPGGRGGKSVTLGTGVGLSVLSTPATVGLSRKVGEASENTDCEGSSVGTIGLAEDVEAIGSACSLAVVTKLSKISDAVKTRSSPSVLAAAEVDGGGVELSNSSAGSSMT